MHPGANRGVIPLEKLATGVKLQLRAMIVVGGPGRANECDIVGALGQVRPPVADFDAALPTLALADLQRQQSLHELPLFHRGVDMVLNVRRVQHSSIRCLADGLSAIFAKSGLGVKTFHVTDTAQHEDPDDALGFRSEVRFAIRAGPILHGSRPRNAVVLQHCAQHQPGKTKTGISQKRSATDPSTTTAEYWTHLPHVSPLTNRHEVIVIE